MKKATIIRTILLTYALINQSLVLAGYSPLPFVEGDLEIFLTGAFTTVASVIAWWKNNSFTKDAQVADMLLEDFRHTFKEEK